MAYMQKVRLPQAYDDEDYEVMLEANYPDFEMIGHETMLLQVGSGDDQESFSAHKHLLCARAPYFRRMMNFNNVEAQTLVAKLAETTTAAFSAFLGWLCTCRVKPLTIIDVEAEVDEHPEQPPPSQFSYPILEVEVLADYLDLPDLVDTITDVIVKAFREVEGEPNLRTIKDICELIEFERGHGLRRYAAHHIACVMMKDKNIALEDIMEIWTEHPEFQRECVQVIRVRCTFPDIDEIGLCKYHHH